MAPPLERLAPRPRPLTIDDDQWRDLHHALRLSAFNLHTQSRDAGHGHPQTGFTGTATLRLDKNAPTAVAQSFGTLTRFAEFSGTGAQTTHGFGATSILATRDQLPQDGH
jgi:CRISPR/Cas system endoribonuclease Cas6 (RAMP superfamily)